MNDSGSGAGPQAQQAKRRGLIALDCARPLLVADLGGPHDTLSWAPARPGFQTTRRVAWLELKDADLPIGVDAGALLAARLAAAGLGDAVAMITARDVSRRRLGRGQAGAVAAECVATVGLANAARIGGPPPAAGGRVGTVNLLVAVSVPMTGAALVEAVSIAAEARTAAIMECGRRIDGAPVTGTGTDCIVAAAPAGANPATFAGLHTEIGQALGAAVYEAVRAGASDWMAEPRESFR